MGTQQPENVLEESAEVANRAEPTSTHFNTSEFGKFLEVRCLVLPEPLHL